MYYNQELGLCIEFGPVRVDSVRRGGAPPPWIKSPLRRFTPSWTSTRVTCDCLLPFVHPLLSQVSCAAMPARKRVTRLEAAGFRTPFSGAYIHTYIQVLDIYLHYTTLDIPY